MNFYPLRDFVLVTKEVEDEKTSSGLLFKPQNVESKVVKGVVVAVGPGTPLDNGTVRPLDVKVGNTVLFNKNYAAELTDGDESLLLLREDQLFCVVK